MPTPKDILLNFVLPAVVAGVALAVGWFRRRDGRWIGALAIGGGFIIADGGISGWPAWPPGTGDAAYWIFWFAVVAAVAGMADALLPIPIWPRATLVWIVSRIGVQLLLEPLAKSLGASVGIAADSIALAVTIWWIAWENLAARKAGLSAPILMTIVLAGCGGTYAIANDIKPSQAMAALMGIGIAACAAAFLWRNLSLERGAALAFVIPLAGMAVLVHYYYYTEPPGLAVAALYAAPLLALLADVAPPRWRMATRVGLVVVMAALAVGLSAKQFLAPAPASNGQPAAAPQDE